MNKKVLMLVAIVIILILIVALAILGMSRNVSNNESLSGDENSRR